MVKVTLYYFILCVSQVFLCVLVCFGSYFDYIVEWNKHVDDKKVMAVTFEDMKIVSLIFTHLFFFCSGANWIILVFVFWTSIGLTVDIGLCIGRF